MGEARQRRAAGLGFKSESREVQKIQRAREKEIAFEKSFLEEDEEFDKMLQDGEEFFNDDTGKWEPIFNYE